MRSSRMLNFVVSASSSVVVWEPLPTRRNALSTSLREMVLPLTTAQVSGGTGGGGGGADDRQPAARAAIGITPIRRTSTRTSTTMDERGIQRISAEYSQHARPNKGGRVRSPVGSTDSAGGREAMDVSHGAGDDRSIGIGGGVDR